MSDLAQLVVYALALGSSAWGSEPAGPYLGAATAAVHSAVHSGGQVKGRLKAEGTLESVIQEAEAPAQAAPRVFGKGPAVPVGPLSEELSKAVDTAFVRGLRGEAWGEEQFDALKEIGKSEDVRLAWVTADLMRLIQGRGMRTLLSQTAGELMGLQTDGHLDWDSITDHLIAWDVAAPPNYLELKRGIFTVIVPEWERIFQAGDINWRQVTWGGVRIDDRAFGTTDEPCNCIPAADNPGVTDVAGGDWIDDDDVIFGVEVGGEFRAYPRQIMEVREMINDTLGGRDLGIPYCTLCGSAQAYFTDRMPEGVARPVLRTSGLLIRSNKLMFDLVTYSVFDTFLGKAVTGPLAKRGIVLPQASVVTTTWGEWKAAHPSTTVLEEKLALGRDFDFRNGRDADGPIFPIGDLDPRLPVQEDVVGILTAKGEPIAFHVKSALEHLRAGKTVSYENVSLVLDAGGLRAIGAEGEQLGSHQAFWFAWSQFHPGTALWLH